MWDSTDSSGTESPRGVTPDTIRRWADVTTYTDITDMDADTPLTVPTGPAALEVMMLKKRNRELGAILEISKSLIAPFHLGQFIYEIVTKCCRVLRAERGSVLLQEAGSGKLHFFWVHGTDAEKVCEVTLDKGQGIAGWSAETGKPALVNRVHEDPRFYSGIDRETGAETRNVLCAPIIGPEGVIGVVELVNKKSGAEFVDDDLSFLEVLCAEVALAIQSFREREKAQRNDRMALLGSMASSIIHDLKNPMAIIKGYTYILGQQYPEASPHLQQIDTEMDRLTELAEEILGVARGKTKVQREWTAVVPFLDDFAQFVRVRLHLDHVRLELRNEFDGKALLDPRRLRRALMNVVTNAFDALDEGGRIEIHARAEGGWLQISVTDDGPGIPAEVRAGLLDPFHISRKPGGTGLGMAIVQSIVEAHGGELGIDTADGEGTRVTLRMPLGLQD